jgi:hypothetical protein
MVELKQGDTSRPITDSLLLGGNAIDLTDCTVSLLLKDENGLVPVIRQTAAITDAHNGKVQYQPVDSDVAKPVTFELEWEITFSNGSQLTVPTHGYGKLRINRNLAT